MRIEQQIAKPIGTYVCAKLTGQSSHDLIKRLRDIGARGQTSRGPLHLTLMYDENTPYIAYSLPELKSCNGRITGIKVMGDKKNIAALIVDCEEIVDFHESLKSYGYTHSFPDFIPHISIMKDFTPEDLINMETAFLTEPVYIEFSHASANPLEP